MNTRGKRKACARARVRASGVCVRVRVCVQQRESACAGCPLRLTICNRQTVSIVCNVLSGSTTTYHCMCVKCAHIAGFILNVLHNTCTTKGTPPRGWQRLERTFISLSQDHHLQLPVSPWTKGATGQKGRL